MAAPCRNLAWGWNSRTAPDISPPSSTSVTRARSSGPVEASTSSATSPLHTPPPQVPRFFRRLARRSRWNASSSICTGTLISESLWPFRRELNIPLSGNKALLPKTRQRPPGCNMLRVAQPVRADPINFSKEKPPRQVCRDGRSNKSGAFHSSLLMGKRKRPIRERKNKKLIQKAVTNAGLGVPLVTVENLKPTASEQFPRPAVAECIVITSVLDHLVPIVR